ncbi:MAG: winged helix-turn-helix domain-containing protein [Promethearchaeota archaeon]
MYQNDISIDLHNTQLKDTLKKTQLDVKGNKSIEELFGSKGQVKILKILATKNELNISKIAQETHLNHNSTRNHLNRFVKADIVEKKTFGRLHIYRLRTENMKVRAIKRLFELWENSDLFR